MRRAWKLAVALSSFAGLSGCATKPPPPIELGFPTSQLAPPSAYKDAYVRYVRHGHLTHDYDTALDADVALLVPAYRAAWAGRLASLQNLPPVDAAALGEQQQRETAAHVEFVIAMQTSRWEWNDLGTSKSVWTITVHDDEGRSMLPLSRTTFDVKTEVLQAMFSDVTPFTRAWKVRFPLAFPDGTPLLRPGAKEISLQMAGPLGKEWFRWRVKQPE